MLHPYLLRIRSNEGADEAGIPQLAGDAEVFAAAHQGVGFAAFGGGGDAVRGEVVHFAAGDGDESVTAEGISFVALLNSREVGDEVDDGGLGTQGL